MKWSLVLFVASLFFCSMAAFPQPGQNGDFAGIWYAKIDNDSMKLNFIGDTDVLVNLNRYDKFHGKYDFEARSNKVLMKVWPAEKKRRDTLLFIMTKNTDDEYIINQLAHVYFERPPEMLLLESKTYFLRRLKP
ncbi:MAG: hypothetical protein JST47_11050 [Bacteroidetes bacterium]|nr:hypothetical protein [Bacteroidota bacterium]MBS1973477.1 hypothetical protein [Bacteroidota bacterium]